MNSLLAFIRLDFYTVKPYTRSMLMLAVVAIFMAVVTKSPTTMCTYLMMYLTLSGSYPFSICEKDGLDTLYSTLALKRRSIVIGRYLYMVSMQVICLIIQTAVIWFLASFFKFEINISETLLITCVMLAVCTIFLSIQFPIYFKLGYNKAKFVASLPFIIIFILIALGGGLLKNTPVPAGLDLEAISNFIETNVLLISLLAVLVGYAAFAASCALSCRFYVKRDL